MKKLIIIIKSIVFTISILFLVFLFGCWYNHTIRNAAKESARQILCDRYTLFFEIEETVYDKWTVSRDDCVPKYSRNSYRMRAYLPEDSENKFWIVLDRKLRYVADEYKK